MEVGRRGRRRRRREKELNGDKAVKGSSGEGQAWGGGRRGRGPGGDPIVFWGVYKGF